MCFFNIYSRKGQRKELGLEPESSVLSLGIFFQTLKPSGISPGGYLNYLEPVTLLLSSSSCLQYVSL